MIFQFMNHILRDIKTKERFLDESNKHGKRFKAEETGRIISE